MIFEYNKELMYMYSASLVPNKTKPSLNLNPTQTAPACYLFLFVLVLKQMENIGNKSFSTKTKQMTFSFW